MESTMIYLGLSLIGLVAVVFLFRGRSKDASSNDASALATEDKRSLYEQLGGAAAISQAVNIFYDKVLKDDRIKHFFDGVAMHRQIVKQIEFLTLALGGPNTYTGSALKQAHAHLIPKGLNDTHFDAVLEHLGATLKELNVPGALIAQAAAIVESTRKDVLSKQA